LFEDTSEFNRLVALDAVARLLDVNDLRIGSAFHELGFVCVVNN
jgi:hypothetical protein